MSMKPPDAPLPPHALLTALIFDADGHTLHAELHEDGVQDVDASRVQGLHGARIHHSEWAGPTTYSAADDEFAHESVTPSRQDQYLSLVALNVDGVKEVWYLHLDALNYRRSLGAEADLTNAINKPLFLQKLAAFCAGAQKDEGFEAMLAHKTATTVETIREFFEAVKSTGP